MKWGYVDKGNSATKFTAVWKGSYAHGPETTEEPEGIAREIKLQQVPAQQVLFTDYKNKVEAQ